MNLTSNFDFCVELGGAPVRAIFHLALKNEELFPHNIGPFTRTYFGRTMTINGRLLDDVDSPADLSFEDDKHLRFAMPFEVTANIPDAPDPTLSQVTITSVVSVPGKLDTWQVDGKDQVGIHFADLAAADVTLGEIQGLPAFNAARVSAALHTKYPTIQHVYTHLGNTLVLYDGNRDPSLTPANAATPFEIEAALETHGGTDYVKITAPIHVTVPQAANWTSFGRMIFWREITFSDTSVLVNMAVEPADAALKNTVELDSGPAFVRDQVVAALTPLAQTALTPFGTVTEPWFTSNGASTVLIAEIVDYLKPRRYPMYTPDSGDPEEPLSTPVGFLIPAAEVLAILMNRRDSSVADFAPDDFTDGAQVALGVGPERINEIIQQTIDEEFPGVNDGGFEVENEEGTATLYTLSVSLADPGEHDVDEGHLWVSGTAEVHIDCWPDPDVSFDGPIFLRVEVTETEEECSMEVKPEAGDFDFDQSCCDVFLDLIIPIVGWIMLAVIESTIDEVGGELATDIAGEQADEINAIPPTVTGVAEVQACLEDLKVTRDGFVFPGKIRVRREGRSFEDLSASGDLPRP
jgi:hypothetical protein